MTSQARELTRHFFWRFFDNDLVSPDADIHETAAFVLAFLVAPSVLDVPGLAFNYGNSFTPPLERLDMIVRAQFGYVAWAMLVPALVATLVWEALTLDGRDYAILGPLPISSRALLGAKLRAAAVFVLALIVAVNGVSAVAFPLLALGPNGSLGGTIVLMLGHLVATTAAAAFGFFAVLALRGLFANLLGARLFARLGVVLQFLIALCLVLAYLSLSVDVLNGPGNTADYSPPIWFLALYQAICPRIVAGVPAPHEALFLRLSPWAVIATCLAVGSGLLLYLAAHVRFARTKPQAYAAVGRRRVAAFVSHWLGRLLVRDVVKRATFLFSAQTLGRSARHRLYVAGYLLGGCALGYLTVVTFAPEGKIGPLRVPAPRLLAVQPILVLALLVGIRVALATPAELKAAWLFRLTAGGAVSMGRYVGGVRRAVFACFALPLLLLLLPVHALAWGAEYAALHAALGALWALLLVEVLLGRLAKLPFTCARARGNNRLLFRWPIYLAGVMLYAFGFARVEYLAITAGSARYLAATLVLFYASLVAYRMLRTRHPASFVFDEAPEGATTLNLS